MNTNKDQVIVDKDKYDALLKTHEIFITQLVHGLYHNGKCQTMFIPLSNEEALSILKKESEIIRNQTKILKEQSAILKREFEAKMKMAESIKNSKPWWRWW